MYQFVKTSKLNYISKFTGLHIKLSVQMLFSCMRIFPIFVALALILPHANATFSIDINKTIIQTNSQWSRVKLSFKDGQQPFQIFYDQYPVGWSQVINYIYIPVDRKVDNRKYPCRFRAIDSKNNQVNGTTVFTISSGKFFISDSLFDYYQVFDDGFFNSGIFSGRPQLFKANGTILSGDVANIGDFTVQQDVVQKINSLSQASGAGLTDILNGLANQNNTITMANVKASMQFRDQLINASIATTQNKSSAFSNISMSNNRNNIASIAAASAASDPVPFNAAGTALQVPNTVTLSASQKQLVLISNIRATEINQQSQQRSIDSIFFRLPGLQELDSIILSADGFLLLQTIQKVVSSQLNCDQKISYLSQLFGRIQSAISIKAFAATQLSVIVEGAQSQINRINTIINSNKQGISALGLENLRNKLNTGLIQLQQAYSKFNVADSQIPFKQNLVNTLKKNIDILTAKGDANRQQIPIQKLQTNEITSQIALLDAQYKDAISKRSVFNNNIQKLNASVLGYDGKISENQKAISDAQSQIKKRQDNAMKTKSTYQTLQVVIQRQRTQITTKQKSRTQINILINNLQSQVQIKKKQLNNTVQITRLRDLVKNLQVLQPNITVQIDDVNFKCNQLKQVEQVKSSNITVYNVIPKDYNTYVQSCYQIKPDNINLKVNKLVVTPLSIQDLIWGKAFGNPYSQTSFVQTKDFSFVQDFNCLGAPSGLQSGSGPIKSVNKRFIQVDYLGRIHKLNLGACSRVQSADTLPKIGQKIYFKGQRTTKTDFNLYKGSCL